jgi:hypothetical protein
MLPFCLNRIELNKINLAKAGLIGIMSLLFSVVPLQAQTTIKGTVRDNRGESIPGANILLEDTYDGTTSSPDGTFSFETDESGRFVLIASFIGYKAFSDTLVLAGGSISIDPVLKEEFNELNAVVISAGAFEASDEGKAVMFKPLDIVTTAGATGDIFGALATLPGAQQVGNEEGLFVRGGAGYETKTIIDGLTVQNPFFSQVPDVPSRGRFSPFLFKGTVFSTGGYSAQYGQALSSAVILNTSDMPRTSNSGLSLSPIFGGASTQQAWEKTAFAVGGQYTNTYLFNALIPQEIEWTKDFQGLGGNLSFLRKTSQTGLLKVYGTYNASSLGIRYPSPIDSLPGVDFLLDNKNAYINASWKEILNDQWTVLISGAASYNDDAILIQGFDNSRNDYGAQGRIALTNQITEKVKVLGGAEYAYQFYENRFNLFGVDQAFDSQIQEHYGALFLESEFYITNDLAGRAGFRGEYSKALDDYNLAPRLSLAYKTGENSQISFAYGQFYQTPRPQFLGLGEDNLTFERADHYIANWQIVTRDRTFRLEGYYKKYDHLVTQNPIDSLAQNLTYSSNGNGYAGGAEIFYRDKKSIDNGDFWISYSWIDTRRIFLDYPEKVRPDFAAEHLLSLVYKHYFPDISSQVGVTYTFQSGRPYHDPASAAFMDGRTASFNNLSANWSYLTNIGGHFTVFFASVTNILGIDNVFAYRYFDSQGSPLPNYAFNLEAEEYIEVANRPPALRSYFIGMFISFQHTRKPKNLIAPGDAGQQNTAP